jgi:cold shock CspA family protein/arsenate reductase-like glutaredoxin family protein
VAIGIAIGVEGGTWARKGLFRDGASARDVATQIHFTGRVGWLISIGKSMSNGTVKFFNVAKGFGFITSDEGGKDVFVPAASIASAGVSGLKAGQRVSYQTMPDTKGPKAVELKILAPVQTPRPPQQIKAAVPVASPEPHTLTVYIDPDSPAAGEVLAELRRAGHDPVVVDYIASPPSKEELKILSLLLRDSDQSLVRKYEHLFLELRLDDRFIGDSEYWAAIFEHPTLINGPVVATATRASICHSKNAVKAFLSAPGGTQPAAKPKGLPPSMRGLVSGGAPLPPPVKEAATEKHQPKASAAEVKVAVKIEVKKAEVKKTEVAVAPKAAAKPKAKPKSPVKAKPAPKKTAPKPAKKSPRKAKR